MEARYEVTFRTSLGNSKRFVIKNANLNLLKASMTTAINVLMSANTMDPYKDAFAKVLKVQSVTVEKTRKF